jgi:hypothetical protein
LGEYVKAVLNKTAHGRSFSTTLIDVTTHLDRLCVDMAIVRGIKALPKTAERVAA